MSMRGTVTRHRRTTALLAGSIAAALVTVPATGASAATAEHGNCPPAAINLTGLSEVVTELVYNDVAPTGPSVGDTGTFVDDLYAADGTLLGTVDGSVHILFARASDGHLFASYDQQIVLADGTIHSYGLVDVENEVAGVWVSTPAWGTGGRYVGMVGVRSWKAESRVLAEAQLELHGRR